MNPPTVSVKLVVHNGEATGVSGDHENREHGIYECLIPFARCGSNAARGAAVMRRAVWQRCGSLLPLHGMVVARCISVVTVAAAEPLPHHHRIATAPLPHRQYGIALLSSLLIPLYVSFTFYKIW